MSQANSFVERHVAKVRAHPWGAAVIVLGSLVITLSSFSDAAKNLWSLFSKPSPMEARVELNRLSIGYSEDSFLDKAKVGDVVAVKLFLAAGMNPNALGSTQVTALCTAAAEDHLPVVEELLENKADTRIGNLPALVCAAYGGASNALLTHLLDADPEPVLQQEASYAAALHGHLDALRFFLDRSPQLITTPADGDTLLINAVRSGNLELVKYLIARGAAVHDTGEQGRTALHTAADKGDTELVRLLLDSNAKVDAIDDIGMTPLHLAIPTGAAAIPRMLIDAGANPNAACVCPDQYGGQASPLLLASDGGRNDIAEVLLQAGADTSAVSKDGWRPLLRSAGNDCWTGEMTQKLLDKGADPNGPPNADGVTPLIYAQMRECFGATKALLASGADVNLRDKDGFTALIYAIQSGSRGATRALIDAGAKLHAGDAMPDSSPPAQWIKKHISIENKEEMQQLVERAYTQK